MKDRFEAINEIDVSSFFEKSDPGLSEIDVLIANTLETDGALSRQAFLLVINSNR